MSKHNSTTYEQLDSSQLEYLQVELSSLNQNVFEGTKMDGSREQGRTPSGLSSDNVYPRGHHGTALPQVSPEAYAYLIRALLSLQGAIQPPPAHGNQLESVPYLQELFPGLFMSSVPPHFPHQPMHPHSLPVIQSTGSLPQPSLSDPQSMETPHSANFRADAHLDTGDTADEAALVTEDKRRRNTSASAKFRIKKKQKTLNLERSVSDLTGRIEELEREASDLRRENNWLKEIVLLKSRSVFESSSSSSSQHQSNTLSSGSKGGPGSDIESR